MATCICLAAGVFGIETLVKQVVDQILEQTKSLERPTSCQAAAEASGTAAESQESDSKGDDGSSKIILTGMKVGGCVGYGW